MGYLPKEYENKCLTQKIQFIKELQEENTELEKELAKRAEQIEALNKDKDYFSDALDKQIEATYKVVEENTKLRKDLEELTITNNYQKVISDKNEQISFLETQLSKAKSLINRLSEYIVLSEDYWKKEDVENQKEILREAEAFLKEKENDNKVFFPRYL